MSSSGLSRGPIVPRACGIDDVRVNPRKLAALRMRGWMGPGDPRNKSEGRQARHDSFGSHSHPRNCILGIHARNEGFYAISLAETVRPSAASTVATMSAALRPARSYIFSGLSWSMNVSGSTIGRTLRLRSRSPDCASSCRT